MINPKYAINRQRNKKKEAYKKSLGHFLKALWVFILMYREGFYWSKNDHFEKPKEYSGKNHWGFYRLNWENEYALADIDFSFNSNPENRLKNLYSKDRQIAGSRNYFHLHAGPGMSIFRLHF